MNSPVDEGGLEEWEKRALERAVAADDFIYFVDFSNKGGLVMPLPLKVTYADGTNKEVMLPAEIWRRDATKVTRLMISDKQITSISIDDAHQIADANYQNNHFPRKITPSRLQAFKAADTTRNLMKDMMQELKSEQKDMPTDAMDRPTPLKPVKR